MYLYYELWYKGRTGSGLIPTELRSMSERFAYADDEMRKRGILESFILEVFEDGGEFKYTGRHWRIWHDPRFMKRENKQ